MSKFIFLFDLDSTITKVEILPTIAKELGLLEEMNRQTEEAMKGEVPFKVSFLNRVNMLKQVPVSKVRKLIGEIELNEKLVSFIRENKERSYIVTGNLDVWIADLIVRIGIGENVYCSKAFVENDHIRDVFSVIDKNAVVSQIILPFVAVGDGNNDAEMIEAAEVGIGYGGVRNIAPSILECATHAIYEEGQLVKFLRNIL